MKTKIIQNFNEGALDALIAEKSAQGKTVIVQMIQNNQVNARTERDIPRGIHLMCDVFNEVGPPRLNNIILKALVAACQVCKTKKEAAEFLGVSYETMLRYVDEGKPIRFSSKNNNFAALGDGSE